MNKKPTLLVLAAGMGSRFGGLKQIAPLGPNGETIIDYSIYDALRAGFGKVVFVIRKSIEDDFKKIISSKYEGRVEVVCVCQELDCLPEGFHCPAERTKPWGTAHAILMAKDCIDGFFAVINGDDFYGCHAFQTLADYLNSLSLERDSDMYSMVAYRLSNTLSENGSVSRGVCQADGGYLTKVQEFTKIARTKDGGIVNANEDGTVAALAPDTLVSMNFWGFHPSLFGHIDRIFREFLKENIDKPKSECYIPSVVDELIRSQKARVKVLTTDAKWFGITYQEDSDGVKSSLLKLHRDGVYPEKLW